MEPIEAWNRQWRSPLVSTLAGSLDAETLGRIEQGWRAFFAVLPAGAKILDIGTGNGYLALLALNAGRNFEVYGADAAAINPPAFVPARKDQLVKIHFHPDMPAEHLRFADGTFDAVVGQHALEYCEADAAVREIARVLKPQGKARFLLHAAGSEILKANLPKIAEFRFVLHEAKLFELAEAAIAEALQGKGDGGASLFRALDAAAERFRGDPNLADLHALFSLLRGAFERRADFGSIDKVRAWLIENRAETEAVLSRIEAMKRAALGKDALGRFVTLCTEAGLRGAQTDKLSTRTGGLLGWVMTAEKP